MGLSIHLGTLHRLAYLLAHGAESPCIRCIRCIIYVICILSDICVMYRGGEVQNALEVFNCGKHPYCTVRRFDTEINARNPFFNTGYNPCDESSRTSMLMAKRNLRPLELGRV